MANFTQRICKLIGKKVILDTTKGAPVSGKLVEVGDDFLSILENLKDRQVRGWRPTRTHYRLEHVVWIELFTKSKLK